MPRTKKLLAPVTLFAAIEQQQHEALRRIAFTQRRSLADVTRTALEEFIKRQAAVGSGRRKPLSRRTA
jgi:hypothetical protein